MLKISGGILYDIIAQCRQKWVGKTLETGADGATVFSAGDAGSPPHTWTLAGAMGKEGGCRKLCHPMAVERLNEL
jgi:hypothetical protein